MLTLGVSQKPVVMPAYPHMLAEDTAVWSKYLASPLVPIKEVWYDVHVGKPVDVGEAASDMDRRIAAGLTRKRIDVVALVGGGFWVIEVKPRANMVALGQVLTYTRLFIQEYAPPGEVWPVIVCDAVDEDFDR
ncbi:unnamed protein product [marine sediment metagenome]|uniref:Uncharacterized protein n=1 Tax=marine sediment metagenome TaxID=412755 RepID=X1IMP8_9ZZZZ